VPRRMIRLSRRRAPSSQQFTTGAPSGLPRAAFVLGDVYRQEGDLDAAESYLQVARDSGHPEWAPLAEIGEGVLRMTRGDAQGAQRAYEA
jgi:hypothetical protein